MPPRPPATLFHLPPSFLAPRLSSATASNVGGNVNLSSGSSATTTTFVQTRSIRSIVPSPHKHKPTRYHRSANLPTLTASAEAAHARKANTLPPRTGVLGIKKGMSAVYDPETGRRWPVTVIQLDRVQVVAHKTQADHGYCAVQVGAGWKHHTNVTRPMLGHYASNGVSPKRFVAEFRVKSEAGLLPVGSLLTPTWFQEGQYVDARANCKGKGFAGGMKRHGFGGQPASHGVSLSHRSMGSAGQGQGGGSRVLPGKKMAGNMGGQRVTMQNIKVIKVDNDNGLLLLSGSIPGPTKGIVHIQDAIKKPWPDMASIPLAAV